MEEMRPKGRGSHIPCWRCMIQGGVTFQVQKGQDPKQEESYPMLGVHDPCGGGGGGGLTSQAGDGLHDPERGPTPRGDPCPGGVAKTDPAPRRKRGVAWPARSWGLPGGGRGLDGGGVATDAIRGAWSPPPPRRRRRARRTVRVGGEGGCAPLPAPRHGLLPPRPPAPPYRGEKPPSPPRSALECTYPKPWLLPGVVLRDGSERRERATKLAGTERSAGRAHSEAPAARADCGARQPISERGAFHSPGGAGGGGEWGRGGTNAWGGQGEPRSDRWAVGGEQGALGRHHFVAAGDDRGILGAAGSQPKGQDCRCVSGNRVF